ncbi:tyrosine-type recombinase/integrase [Bifidobacterium sp. W8108]|uniref:tyrosine-type recombinase/integrase n=1 Tax=unclassified Bifidobacterium TaxID=2608897 RepID=UPI0018DCDF26|nr:MULTISPECIES: tyrosine-type recombinase/integrase [unclassified Bifidobacterium]MBH9978158.1 tyrosine-type recombinase/integrase [Bifidobacterium sp. W8108]MBI0173972.1 tyrosine-type recombinase/integrase [Bifidobacterium sp. M0307]
MEFPEHRQPPAGWVGCVDDWVASLRVRGDTDATVEHWWYLVTQFAIFVRKDPKDVQTQDVLPWLTRGVSTSSIRSGVNALRSFYGWLHREKVVVDNPMEGIPSVKRQRKKQKPAPQAAVDRGLNHVDPRVRLLVRLFSEAGLRRSEAIAARSDDLLEDLAGMSLLVHGKGDKDRMVPLSDGLTRELSSLPKGYFFPGRHRGHICPDTAYALVKDGTGWPPHSFRRRFATDVWKATGDVVKVQSLLGHESLATTQAYIYDTTDDLRQAVDSMLSYRSHKGVRIPQPEKILEAYGLPLPVIDRILARSENEYRQGQLFG